MFVCSQQIERERDERLMFECVCVFDFERENQVVCCACMRDEEAAAVVVCVMCVCVQDR